LVITIIFLSEGAFSQCGSCINGGPADGDNFWTGDISSDWNNAANWSDGLPQNNDNLTVNPEDYTGVGASPIISTASSFQPADIRIVNGGILTISNDLTILDDFVVYGEGSTLTITAGSNASGDDTTICRGGILNQSGGTFDNTSSGGGILKICTSEPAGASDPDINFSGGAFNSNNTSVGADQTDAAASPADADLYIDVTGDGSYTDNTNPAINDAVNPSTLPVELLSFDAAPQGTNVHLEWCTAVEINNSHFEIQRSPDGVNFQVIGIVGGHGTTEEIRHYNFVDYSPLEVGYYRMKQVDYDGRFEYFSILFVSFVYNSQYSLHLPAEGRPFVSFSSDEPLRLTLIDSQGQIVKETTAAYNYYIVTSSLPKGLYMIRIQGNTGLVETRKFLVF